MREKLIRIRKAENGYILTVYFQGVSGSERTLICLNLEEVSKALTHEFELTKNLEGNFGNVKV